MKLEPLPPHPLQFFESVLVNLPTSEPNCQLAPMQLCQIVKQTSRAALGYTTSDINKTHFFDWRFPTVISLIRTNYYFFLALLIDPVNNSLLLDVCLIESRDFGPNGDWNEGT